MLEHPEECGHEHRQAVSVSEEQLMEAGKFLISRIYVVCLDCGKAEEATL